MATLQKADFDRIKSMQKRGRRIETIVKQVPWSERTIDRVLKAGSWSVYRTRIRKETRRIAEARAKGILKPANDKKFVHGNEAGTYELTDPPIISHRRVRINEKFLDQELQSTRRPSFKERLFHIFSRNK